MKKFAMLLFAVTMAFTSYAHGDKPSNSNLLELRDEITDMIGHPRMDESNVEARVTLHFTVNAKNQVVVLTTNNEEFDEYIKDRLNYQELEKSTATINEKYTLPLIIRKG